MPYPPVPAFADRPFTGAPSPPVGRPVDAADLPPELAALGPLADGRLGVLEIPAALDPVVYCAHSRAAGLVYVGRTGDLPGRIARHYRRFEAEAVARPDQWFVVRVPGPDAARAEEGLIRLLRPAYNRARDPRVTGPQADALGRLGVVVPAGHRLGGLP